MQLIESERRIYESVRIHTTVKGAWEDMEMDMSHLPRLPPSPEDAVDDDDGDGEEDEHAQAMDFLFFMEMPFASGESFSFLNFLFSIEGTVYLKPGR